MKKLIGYKHVKLSGYKLIGHKHVKLSGYKHVQTKWLQACKTDLLQAQACNLLI